MAPTNEDLVEILTPMTIYPGATFRIFSPAPILIRPLNGRPFEIKASTPTIVVSTDCVTVESATPLDSRFAKGWNNLATELKVKVLSYNLVMNAHIDQEYAQARAIPALVSHLLMTPEIANLSHEIFYSLNTFNIRLAAITAFPKPQVTHYITRLTLTVGIFCNWKFVRRVANGGYGFQRLKHVTLLFTTEGLRLGMYDIWITYRVASWEDALEKDGLKDGIDFRVPGEVKVHMAWQSGNDTHHENGIRQALQSKIRFGIKDTPDYNDKNDHGSSSSGSKKGVRSAGNETATENVVAHGEANAKASAM